MSDDEEQYNPKSHKNLLQAISSLGKAQHIRKSSRNEPQTQQDEFQLAKTRTYTEHRAAHPVGINDIVQILRTTKKHIDAGKQLKNAQSAKKVLKKPMEKPAADRLKRTIGYESVKKKLERWDAIVTKNRSSETQVFPLQTETVYIDTSANSKPLQLSLKSDLRLEMEATEAKLKALKKERMGDNEDEKDLEKREMELLKKKLTRDELMARRKELAYLKMRESQKSAKARMQNKIKSKKYHKLLKRQKLHEQIKQFELLQKTNPEAALEKLNELEKSRVLERASLRHKNTGSWAQNLQVRAKYDKDVRKDLAEQLQISRQLTQKKTHIESDDNDDDGEETSKKPAEMTEDNVTNDPFNPWTRVGGNVKQAKSDEEEKEHWRKYWLERNINEKLLDEYKKVLADGMKEDNDGIKEGNGGDEVAAVDNDIKVPEKKTKVVKTVLKPKSEKPKKSTKKPVIENGWIVEEVDTRPARKVKNIDDIFDAQEEKIRNKLSKKLKILTNQASQLNRPKPIQKKSKAKKDPLKQLNDLAFKNEIKRPIIDEELNHEELSKHDNGINEALIKSSTDVGDEGTKAIATANTKSARPSLPADTIDPNKLATVKLKQKHLNTFAAINDAIADADMEEMDENDAQAAQQMTISQAFEDDDIVADFSKDKSTDAELKGTEIQLSMPGWGSWGGAGISQERSNNKNKRLVLKLAKEEKRRDDNKDGLYINETASKQLRTHLVSDVPFPFTSLQDYEASIRAPIGRNFVPETAFRMLTRPAVITRKGQVIEPMDDSELVKTPRKLRHIVDRRIERAAKVAPKR